VSGLGDAVRGELFEAPGLVRRQVELVEPLLAGAGCVAAVGAGDSYAAALAAAALGGGRVEAWDPVELVASGRAGWLASRGCWLLALSVGGRSVSVVEAARRFRSAGGRVVAVTADPGSPLAREADVVVELVYGGLAGGVGAARHLVMLAALAGLLGERVRGVPLPSEAPGVGDCTWLRSEVHSGCLDSASTGLYAVLKLYEVYGSSARFYRVEQLVHAPVYSASVFTLYEPAGGPCRERVLEAYEAMREAGLRLSLVPRGSSSAAENVVSQAVSVLTCLAEAADMDGVLEPAYRRHRGLGVLTRLIYG